MLQSRSAARALGSAASFHAEGVSKTLLARNVLLSLAGFTVFYGSLGVIGIWLLAKYARKGMDLKKA